MCVFVQAKRVEEGGFSMRACKEEDGSRLEGFIHSWGLVHMPGAPDAPSWHVHKSPGGQKRMRRVVAVGFFAEHKFSSP